VSLTEAQRAIRATGIGASEIAAVVGVAPHATALEVWMRKPNPARAALVLEDDGDERTEIGDALEPVLRGLFEQRTGHRLSACHRPQTLRHPSLTHVLASPDGILSTERAGLELKVVGARMAHHWDGDVLPDYVATQVAQSMAVTGLPRWYVAALVGGTDLRIIAVDRDAALEEALLGAATRFWTEHVLPNEPPDAASTDDRLAYLAARYPRSKSRVCREAAPEERDVLSLLREAHEIRRLALDQYAAFEASALAAIGADSGIESDVGKMLWIPKPGAVSWKAVAEELAGGVVAADVIEKHRGAPFRSPAFYPRNRTT
jgi:putative phage-type endonuclease